jgi:hypothetical protein
MRHLRTDYDPIQDPRPSGIGEGEPVFLLRAKDELAPTTVHRWATLLEERGGDSELVEAARDWADAMYEWQERHGSKLPDAPTGTLLPFLDPDRGP